MKQNSASISPTAHYTGYVWARHGLGPRELATREGAWLYRALQPAMALSARAGQPTLETFLLARHRIMDHLLHEAIEAGRVTHVIEIAAGMSPRGCDFAAQYGDRITYLETDLPAMAERKRGQLAKLGALTPTHRVEVMDALADTGPNSLGAIASGLESCHGLAVITEGLLNYLPPDAVLGLWRRIHEAIAAAGQGVYLSDLHLGGESGGAVGKAFTLALGIFVRGHVYLHFENSKQATDALVAAGFLDPQLHRPSEFAATVQDAGRRDADVVRIIEAQ